MSPIIARCLALALTFWINPLLAQVGQPSLPAINYAIGPGSVISIGPSPSVGAPATYYVDTAGSDTNNGLSPLTPWQTIGHINSQTFTANSEILFKGGQTFGGGTTGIVLTTSITPGPIYIGAYGTGQPTVSTGNSAACVSATNIPSVVIENIICNGGGATTNTTNGISIQNSSAGQIEGPIINNVTVSGYGVNCIAVEGSNNFTFADISITNSAVHDCTSGSSGQLTSGISIDAIASGGSITNFTNVTISYNTIYNMLGVAGGAVPTGNGVFLDTVTGATIANNYVHTNGANATATAGPSGILAVNSANITTQFNDVESTTVASGSDGDGIDCGGGTTNCIEQYNFTANNAGRGLYSDVGSGGTNSGNIIRFNISQNDGVGLGIVTEGTGITTNCNVYNNTIFGRPTSLLVQVQQQAGSSSQLSCTFSNNVFYDLGVGSFVLQVSTVATPTFTQNDWYGTGTFSWAGATYATYALWQAATGQEKIGGVNVGLHVDPRFVVYGFASSTLGTTPLNANPFQLQQGSPMLNAGLNLTTQYGLNIGTQDFFGAAINAASLPIGAGQQIAWTSGMTTSCAQYTTFLARTSGLDVAHQQQYNALICGLSGDGLLTKLDFFYKFATDTATDAKLSLISTSFPITTNGTIAFTPNQGYQGDGITGYLTNAYTPSTSAVNYAQDSASLGAYVTSPSVVGYGEIGTFHSGFSSFTVVTPSISGNYNFDINDGAGGALAGSNTTILGFWIGARTSSTVRAGYLNGAQLKTDAGVNSAALSDEPMLIDGFNLAGTPTSSGDQLGYAFAGSGLTAQQASDMSYRTNADASALGINAF